MKQEVSLMSLILFVLPPVNKISSQNMLVINSPEETRKGVTATTNLPVFEFRTSLTNQQINEMSVELVENHDLGEKDIEP